VNANKLLDIDQQRILCILIENDKIDEYIQSLSAKHASILKDSRIIDLQELVKFIQSTTANKTHKDASTMTNTDQNSCQTTSCVSFMTQSENARRLKALEFIRIFIEKSKEDFCKYLIHEEHLCQQKTLAIYQMIKQFLSIVYQSEHGQE
jgi:UDP-3-O-[3-hydroxymyristoyl] glucosamine N-acyltransferase